MRRAANVIAIEGLTKTFTRGKRGLDGIALEVKAGEMVALIGASGSGKSTLIRHIAGLVHRRSGLWQRHPGPRSGGAGAGPHAPPTCATSAARSA